MVADQMLKDCRVIVVEDEFIIAHDLCEKLQALGCTIIGPANSADTAISLLEAEAPDVAFINENLSGVSAEPVAAALVERRIPFAIVSGYETARSGTSALRRAERVLKPVSAEAVRETLEALLGLHTKKRSAG